ncbi:MAG: hypothetical protein IJW46_00375 [Clostridia bacterium]|nr:hypothetical protein [Clostridia bacterium]
MKKLTVMLLAIVMLLTFVSCAEETGDAPYGMKLASDPEVVDYKVYVPEDWTITSKTGMTTAQVSLADATNMIITNHSHSNTVEYSDSKNTLIAYLYGADVIKTEAADTTGADANADDRYDKDGYRKYEESLLHKDGCYLNRLYELFDTVKDENGNEISSFTMIEEPAFTTLKKGDNAVAALTFVYSGTLDGAEVQQKMVLAYEDAYFYNITFSTAPALYENHKTTFATILENFTFED